MQAFKPTPINDADEQPLRVEVYVRLPNGQRIGETLELEQAPYLEDPALLAAVAEQAMTAILEDQGLAAFLKREGEATP